MHTVKFSWRSFLPANTIVYIVQFECEYCHMWYAVCERWENFGRHDAFVAMPVVTLRGWVERLFNLVCWRFQNYICVALIYIYIYVHSRAMMPSTGANRHTHVCIAPRVNNLKLSNTLDCIAWRHSLWVLLVLIFCNVEFFLILYLSNVNIYELLLSIVV